jgi:23S rRNA (guanine745-N1)-methyltransferase
MSAPERWERIRAAFTQAAAVFACPVCGNPLDVEAPPARNFLCAQGHRFDFARQGYVNLLLAHQRRSSKSGYTAEMLLARRVVLEHGVFTPLCEAIAALLAGKAPLNTLLDSGAGEGQVLKEILSLLPDADPPLQAMGMDISKDGIRLAAPYCPQALWCVGNGARKLPFLDASFDVLLNILAPGNGPEFQRLLRDDGCLIKVVALENHLIELREALYAQERTEPCSDDQALEALTPHLECVERQRLTYSFDVPQACQEEMLQMSPLYWKCDRQRLATLKDIGLSQVTVDLSVTRWRKETSHV